MFEEKTLSCASCGVDFVFTAEEQEFYQSKGFSEPKRCQPCRRALKQQKQEGRFRQREMFDTVCAGCGVQTQVPFKPDGRKPVYCASCYHATNY